jgi:phosphoribosylformylglycinamidine cyclo-ligase
MNYKTAGVNIDEANAAKKMMATDLNSNSRYMINKVGAFASLINAELKNYQDPILVMKTEEPGSKQLLAAQHGKMPSVCVDMINHLINDCIVTGAKPIAVQDAIICGKLVKEEISEMVSAMAHACREEECELVGGETSEQPGVLQPGQFVLTSSILGVVERSRVLDGSAVQPGYNIIALQSSGPHTNGYTLIRKLLAGNDSRFRGLIADGRSFIRAVLEPHRCYYKAVKHLVEESLVVAMAHITGGGIKENLNRVLPPNVDALVDLGLFPTQRVFKLIMDLGQVPEGDMLRTFNMGVGMALICKSIHTNYILTHVMSQGIHACLIGSTIPGTGVVKTAGNFK